MVFDKPVTFRVSTVLYEHLQRTAAEHDLSLSDYLRLMALFPLPYMLIVSEVGQMVRSRLDDDDTLTLLRSAIARLESGEAEIDQLMEKILVGLPQTQEASRQALIEYKGKLQAWLEKFEAGDKAIRIADQELGKPQVPEGKSHA